jgi:hypothetical protein
VGRLVERIRFSRRSFSKLFLSPSSIMSGSSLTSLATANLLESRTIVLQEIRLV